MTASIQRVTITLITAFLLLAPLSLVLASNHWGAAGDPGFAGPGGTQSGTIQGSGGTQSGTIQGSPDSSKLQNPLKATTIEGFLKSLIEILMVFAVPIIVFFIIYAGFLYVTAQGNSEKIQKATKAITWTLVGGVLVLGAWALIAVIQGTVNALR